MKKSKSRNPDLKNCLTTTDFFLPCLNGLLQKTVDMAYLQTEKVTGKGPTLKGCPGSLEEQTLPFLAENKTESNDDDTLSFLFQ